MAIDWNIITANIKTRVSEQNYLTWFNNIKFDNFDSNSKTVKIIIPDKFTYNWILENYQELLNEVIYNYLQEPIKINFTIEEPQELSHSSNQEKLPSFTSTNVFQNFIAQSLNPKYSFDNFIVGNCNEMARAASLAVSEQPGKNYNPLFIYGGTGLGKTHLLCAIGLELLKNYPQLKISYMSSEKFMNELIASIRNDKMHDFRKKFRENCDVILMDDIQFMSGKERTQEEFFFTFNELYQNRKQIIITSDKKPQDLIDFEERLLTRFNWGLIADLQPPDAETRIAIIRNKALQLKVSIPEDIVLYIAQTIKPPTNSIRDIEGVLNRIHLFYNLSHTEINHAFLKKYLPDLFSSDKSTISLQEIIKSVSLYYNIKINDIISNSRKKELALPRHIAMYLSKKITKFSYPTIAKAFGGKDHTTVIHAFEKIKKEILENPNLEKAIKDIENSLII